MEIRIRKRKYIYTIFLSNQFCIISLNDVTVLHKSVHAVRQCLDKGSFQKWQVFHLRRNISFASKSVHSSWIRPKTDMTLSCSNNCLITRSNQKHVTQHNVLENPRPFLMQSNLKLSRILRLYWMIQGASPELIQQLLYRIEIQAYLTYAVFLASAHTWLPFQRGTYRLLDEVNWLRIELEWKPIVWNLSILEMTPCLFTGVQHEQV